MEMILALYLWLPYAVWKRGWGHLTFVPMIIIGIVINLVNLLEDLNIKVCSLSDLDFYIVNAYLEIYFVMFMVGRYSWWPTNKDNIGLTKRGMTIGIVALAFVMFMSYYDVDLIDFIRKLSELLGLNVGWIDWLEGRGATRWDQYR
jgi:hypothetical protein